MTLVVVLVAVVLSKLSVVIVVGANGVGSAGCGGLQLSIVVVVVANDAGGSAGCGVQK